MCGVYHSTNAHPSQMTRYTIVSKEWYGVRILVPVDMVHAVTISGIYGIRKGFSDGSVKWQFFGISFVSRCLMFAVCHHSLYKYL
ncbi:hypothetical protein L873DRAFT_1465581 [Choiromyces venosus 120613-1]|uniref:Uncharacterized protein n=1 Tax=Choiromyces venosus 120613-1 TaxID=1336337 RepID=A0A3N4K193_9PEZI|nr:hypothetical protein L873DRAFT_1465581 [Choiromyces venosus 120613-1]